MSCSKPERARTLCSDAVMPSCRPMRTHRLPTRPLWARISLSDTLKMRARPMFAWDVPNSGLGIMIAIRYPLWLLVLQFENEPVGEVGRSRSATNQTLPRLHRLAEAGGERRFRQC